MSDAHGVDFDPLAGDRLCLALAEEIPGVGALLDAHLVEQSGQLLGTLFMADLARWAAAGLCGGHDCASEAGALLDRLEEALSQPGSVKDLVATGFIEGLPGDGLPCRAFLDRCRDGLRSEISRVFGVEP